MSGNPYISAKSATRKALKAPKDRQSRLVRGRSDRFEAELTFFRNDIKNYVFRNPVSEEEFHDREEEFDDRFGLGEEDGEDGGHDHGEFPFVEFVGRDSVLMGVEAHLDLKLSSLFTLESTADWVTGELSDTGEALPRIPPFRVTTGLKYQKNAFQLGGSFTAVSDQTRVYGEETPTDGYLTARFYSSYSIARAGALHTFTARLDNATNESYRNHLNYLKDELLEPGRSFKVVYTLGF